MKNISTHVPEIEPEKALDEPLCEISEIAENGADKVLCKSEKNSSVHIKYVNFSSAQKRALDATLYAISAGRSMIEMLGVLAIIGVLSVGAIAGYSKAMMKHKLNVHAQAFNYLLNNAVSFMPQVLNGETVDPDLFSKLNYIPDGFSFQNARIYDNFNNQINISTNGFKDYVIEYSLLRAQNKVTQEAVQVCQNVIEAARQNADNIYVINNRGRNPDAPGGYLNVSLYGNNACNKNRTCLNKTTTLQIADFCSSCESETSCSLVIYFIYGGRTRE